MPVTGGGGGMDTLWAILTWPGWWLLVVVMEIVLAIIFVRIDQPLRRK